MDLNQLISQFPASQRPDDSRKWRELPKELNDFLVAKWIACRPKTIDDYRKKISFFLNFAKKPVPEIDRNDIRLFLLSMDRNKRSPYSIRSYYRTLASFFNWLVAEGDLKKSPMQNVSPPRMPQRLGKGFISRPEFDRLLAKCETNDFRGARDKAWLWLLWSTGCRFSELANLQKDNINLLGNRIRVIGKGDKERVVPFINNDVKQAVHKYIRRREKAFDDEYPCLWLSDRGHPMSQDGLDSLTRRIFDRSGIVGVKDRHHIFRRSWAMRNVDAGVPLEHIAIVGGWTSVLMVEHYIRGYRAEDAINSSRWV